MITTNEKNTHPLTKEIPMNLWIEVFKEQFNEEELHIDNKPFEEVKRADLPNDAEQALIMLLIHYPDISPDQCLNLIKGNLTHQRLFQLTKALGSQWSKDQAPEQGEDIVKEYNASTASLVASNEYFDILKWFKKQAFRLAVFIGNINIFSWVFRGASENDDLDIFKWLKEQDPEQWENVVKANDYLVFRVTASHGHINILKWLKAQVPEQWENMFKGWNYSSFDDAASHGHLNVLKWLKKQASEQWENMVAHFSTAFCYAAHNGHLPILKWLKEQAPEQWEYMVKCDDYYAFRHAALCGHLDILKWLKEQAPEEWDAMVKTRNYSAFIFAAVKGHHTTVNWLLSHLSCFAHAEQHDREYGARYIYPFVNDTLATLHQENEAFLNENPRGVFDIEDINRAQLCFYLLRNLIRRNDRALDDELRFLLSIPSVKDLAHQEITEGRPNELLCIALCTGNQVAAALLLNIEAVRDLAEQNNFYRDMIANGVDLRQLAEDRESAMTALTEGEAKKLEKVTQHYQPMIQSAGIKVIMTELRESLIERYRKKPACIRVDDLGLNLPLTYKEFQSLNLTENQRKEALIAYYQHPVHTAWRYLSKPNAWMHEEASYVYINDSRTERWSTFEEYQPLIALMYLAAIDKEMEPTKEHTLDTRFKHFINELALIGRAHNWDRSRIRNEKEEEYDDLEGDRPSCFSGVKRRLFQSVVSHPFFEVLTEETIEAEIRQFAFVYFISLITEDNKQRFKSIFDEIINELDEQNVAELQYLDISAAKQERFILYLTQKYGAQFSENAQFLAQVKECFSLDPEEKSSRFHYHALKLLGLTGLYDYLEKFCSVIQDKPTDLQVLKNNINLAILGKTDIVNPRTEQPLENSYLDWMSKHATGTRCLTRFSHWYHGDSGVKRARNLLEIANDSNSTEEELLSFLQNTFQESSNHKHSLRRYLVAQFNQTHLNLDNLLELSDNDFAGLKSGFNFS